MFSDSSSLDRLRRRSRWPLVIIFALAGLWMLQLAALHSLLASAATDPAQHRLWGLFSMFMALVMFAGATASFVMLRPRSER